MINKTLVKQVQAETHCIEHTQNNNDLKKLWEVLKLCSPAIVTMPKGNGKFYLVDKEDGWHATIKCPTGYTPIPLDDFFKGGVQATTTFEGKPSEVQLKALAEVVKLAGEELKKQPPMEVLDAAGKYAHGYEVEQGAGVSPKSASFHGYLQGWKDATPSKPATPDQPALPEVYTREQMHTCWMEAIMSFSYEIGYSPTAEDEPKPFSSFNDYLKSINNTKSPIKINDMNENVKDNGLEYFAKTYKPPVRVNNPEASAYSGKTYSFNSVTGELVKDETVTGEQIKAEIANAFRWLAENNFKACSNKEGEHWIDIFGKQIYSDSQLVDVYLKNQYGFLSAHHGLSMANESEVVQDNSLEDFDNIRREYPNINFQENHPTLVNKALLVNLTDWIALNNVQGGEDDKGNVVWRGLFNKRKFTSKQLVDDYIEKQGGAKPEPEIDWKKRHDELKAVVKKDYPNFEFPEHPQTPPRPKGDVQRA